VSWAKIPLALRIAICMNGVFIAIALMSPAVHTFEGAEELSLFRDGCALMVEGFALYGVLELAKLLPRRAAFGARLAAVGWTAAILLMLVHVGLSLDPSWRESATPTIGWVWWGAMLAVGGGLVIAAARKPSVAIAGGVLWLVMVARPPVIQVWIFKQLMNDLTLWSLVNLAGYALQGVAVGLLAGAAVGGVPDGFIVRDPQRVRWGLTKIAGSLWLRLIAMAIVPIVTMVTLGDRAHAIEAVGYTVVGAGVVNGLAMLGFGLGALDAARSNHPDLRRGAFYVAAAAALWCAGVMLHQVPELYRRIFSDPDNYPYERSRVIVEAFEYLLPMVAAAAVAAWTVGVDGFATRRERLDLSERAQRTAVLYIVLSFASYAVSRWLLPDARTDGSRMLVMLVALICGVVALLNAARLASDTAELGNVEQPSIPTATIV